MDEHSEIHNLPVIAIDETIHDLPENVGPTDEPRMDDLPLPSEPLKVLTEEDIVTSCASIAYEGSVRQLAALVHLPVKQCPYTISTGLLCQSLPPFECTIKQRSTAFVVEWVILKLMS